MNRQITIIIIDETALLVPRHSFEYSAVGIRCADHVTLCQLKSALTSPTSGGRSVGIVRLRNKATEFLSETVFEYTRTTRGDLQENSDNQTEV
jgi:hypothetical protein